MADVFISYSQKDRSIVEPLVRLIEASGYTVWWDRKLEGGADFSEEILRQLMSSKAVLVIWTLDSINSQFVRGEAQIANHQGKLIPVKSSNVTYEIIRPPFNVLHCLDLNDHSSTIEAIRKQSATPSSRTSISAWTRYQFLSWFGILGGALTLLSNLRGLVDLARITSLILDGWKTAILAFWKMALFFIPSVEFDLAFVLSFFVFCIACLVSASNIAMSPERIYRKKIQPHTMLDNPVLPAMLVSLIYIIGATDYVVEYSLVGRDFGWSDLFGLRQRLSLWTEYMGTILPRYGKNVLQVVFWIVACWIAAGCIQITLRATIGFKVEASAMAARLWGILIVLCSIYVIDRLGRLVGLVVNPAFQ